MVDKMSRPRGLCCRVCSVWVLIIIYLDETNSAMEPAMRVSEADTVERNQCELPGMLGPTQSGSPTVAVCRPRTRCNLSKIVQPVKLCRTSGRSVMGRALNYRTGSQNRSGQYGDDSHFVMSRTGPEGVCCWLDPLGAPGISHTYHGDKEVKNESLHGYADAGVDQWSTILGNEITDGPSRQLSKTSRRRKNLVFEDALDIIAYSNAFLGQAVDERWQSNDTTIPKVRRTFAAINVGDLGLDCGRRNLNYKMMRVGRIVGGQTAGFSDWPWVVMILNYGRPRCGGTLLSNMTVITAAHCVSGNILLYNLTVRIGMYSTNERDTLPYPPVHLRVVHITRHPDFELTTLLNDVAILQLSDSVTFAPNIMPACLASQEYPPKTSTIVLGWGKEEENNTVYELPDTLQAVSIPIFNRQECTKYFNQQGLTNLIGDQHICAGSDEGGRDACQGDSGGPMVLTNPDGRFELIGIISWGFGCGAPHVPAVYTNIFYFRSWIIEAVKQIADLNQEKSS